MRAGQKRILVVCPTAYKRVVYLPLIWGLLKAEADQSSELRDRYEWLTPFYDLQTLQADLSSQDLGQIDVLALSCYTWNYNVNFLIAKRVKAANPNCLVVAGGPQIDPTQENFFEEHPFIDLAVRGEGEKAFARILHENLNGNHNFSRIPGVRSRFHENFEGNGEAKSDFSTSVYLTNKEAFLSMMEKSVADGRFTIAMFESDRGCPYKCTFCNWGMEERSRVRATDSTMLLKELEFLARSDVGAIEIINSNFGMFPLDLELAKHITKLKQSTGFPRRVYYNSTKSNIKYLDEIGDLFISNGLQEGQPISVQSTNPVALKAVDRRNLSTADLMKLVVSRRKAGIPVFAEVMMGLPGDTLETFKQTFNDLYEMGIVHNQVYPFVMLPNTPATNPEYIQHWGLKGVMRTGYIARRENEHATFPISPMTFCYEHSTMPAQDMVRAAVFSAFFLAFVSKGILKWVVEFARREHGIFPIEFVSDFIHFFAEHPDTFIGKSVCKIDAHYQKFYSPDLSAEEVFEEMKVDFSEFGLNELRYLNSEELVTMSAVLHRDQFWNDMIAFLESKSLWDRRWESLARFQRQFTIGPDFDGTTLAPFLSEWNWPDYFEHKELQRGPFVIHPMATLLGYRMGIPYDWSHHALPERISNYLNYTLSTRYTHYHILVEKFEVRKTSPKVEEGAILS